MELNDFYSLLKDFVQYYPKNTLKCKRLQTFAVIDNLSTLNTENLGKSYIDKDKNYFFSRDWAKFKYNPSKILYSYPGIFVLDLNCVVTDPFKDQSETSYCYNLDIIIVDQYDRTCIEEKTAKDDCALRTPNDIYKDTEIFMKNLIAYLNDIIYINDVGYLNKSIADSAGLTDENRALSHKFHKNLRENNPELSVGRYDSLSLDDVHGINFQLSFCIKTCGKFKYEGEIIEYKKGPDDVCC